MPKKGGYPYKPDYVVPPGWLLEEYLEVNGMSEAELARLCAISPEQVQGILAGEAPIEPDTAERLGEIFDLQAVIWLRMEADYREGLKQGKKVPDLAKEPAV